MIINQGIAGAHKKDIHIGDIVIGEKCCNINSYSMPTKSENEGTNPFEWEPDKRAKQIQNADDNLLKCVKEKLFLKGFTNDVIDKAMAELDFEYDLEKEKLALEKDYLKASHRYEKKLEGKDLRNKIIDTLLKKGYNYEDIKNILEVKENNDE